MLQAAAARHGRLRRHRIGWSLAALLVAAKCWPVPTAGLLPETPREAASRDSSRSAYRLGTAGRPFVWSTAVGDLNADGRADYAVADRVGRRASGAEFLVEFSISGIGSRSVRFDAPDEALAVSLRDVDHDHDLDLVVTALVSRAVVGVWLNDGHGHFQPAPDVAAFSEPQTRPSRADDAAARTTDTATDTTRRLDDGVGAERAVAVAFARLDRLPFGACLAARSRPFAHLRSRAPPAGRDLILT
jgi:hypothetical protein